MLLYNILYCTGSFSETRKLMNKVNTSKISNSNSNS